MLIVRQREGNKSEYERVGIGMVQKGYISRQQADRSCFLNDYTLGIWYNTWYRGIFLC